MGGDGTRDRGGVYAITGSSSARVSRITTKVARAMTRSVSGTAHWNGLDKRVAGTCVLQPGTHRLVATSGTRLHKEQTIVVPESRGSAQFTVALESPWPADGIPVTFRFAMPSGHERYIVHFFVLDVDAVKHIADGGTTISDAGAVEAKARLKPGNYALILTQPLQPKRQPFVVKPGESGQVFEFTVDPP